MYTSGIYVLTKCNYESSALHLAGLTSLFIISELFIRRDAVYTVQTDTHVCVICSTDSGSRKRVSWVFFARHSAQSEVKLLCGNENKSEPWESASIPRVIHL